MDRSRWQGFRIDRPGSATTSYVAMNAMYQHVEIDALDVRTSRSIKILVKNRNRTVHLEISIQRSNLILWSYPFILQFFILLEYPSWNSHQSPCNNPSYCPPHSYWSQWWSYSWIRNGWPTREFGRAPLSSQSPWKEDDLVASVWMPTKFSNTQTVFRE